MDWRERWCSGWYSLPVTSSPYNIFDKWALVPVAYHPARTTDPTMLSLLGMRTKARFRGSHQFHNSSHILPIAVKCTWGMPSVMNPTGWSLAAKLPKGGIFPLLIFLARSVASLNAIVIFIHCWMLCSSSWVVFKMSYTINVGWVGEWRGIIREEHASVGSAEFL